MGEYRQLVDWLATHTGPSSPSHSFFFSYRIYAIACVHLYNFIDHFTYSIVTPSFVQFHVNCCKTSSPQLSSFFTYLQCMHVIKLPLFFFLLPFFFFVFNAHIQEKKNKQSKFLSWLPMQSSHQWTLLARRYIWGGKWLVCHITGPTRGLRRQWLAIVASLDG